MNKILEIIESLPSTSGVYKYLNKNGDILYIGKAKNLKKRVKSYWRFNPFSPNRNLNRRIIKMLNEAYSIEYILTHSEREALILENSLIKEFNPKYNILLRDDKTYPYIYIDNSQDFPRFEITREVKKDKNLTYYGAFPNGAKAIYDSIYELFPLVQKKSCIGGKKACLFYEIGRCLAPCEDKISKSEYKKIITKAKRAISNQNILIRALEKRMIKLASEERFEEAGAIRDRIESIKNLKAKETIDIEVKIYELLDLDKIPYRVEIFDNSHILGEATVGAMVVWNSGKWDKSSYRRYELKSKDEYSQMRELLSRRINNFNKISPPDLWIIDGGDTLLKLAISLLDEVNINLSVIAISKEKLNSTTNRAKGSARDIIYTKESVYELKPRDKRLQWIQKLRDEAHRFVISYHRKKKITKDIRSSILEKKGIGKSTLKRLLDYFGTFEAINLATFDEISVVSGKKVAKILKTENVKK